MVKKKKIKKSRVEKPFNNNTMSNSMFFGWLRSRLRRMSMIGWKPVSAVRKDAQVPYKGDNKRRKYSYICSECKKEVDGKSCAVHHKVPAGSLKSFEDLADFCRRLFVEKSGLILLCNSCHDKAHEELNKLKNDT